MYSKSKAVYNKIMKRKDKHALIALSAVVTVVIAGTFIFRYLEDWTFIESLYFTVATITTVGYGDLHPTTDVSRLAAVGLLLLGVTTVLTSLTVLGTRYIHAQEKLLERRLKNLAEHMPQFLKKDAGGELSKKND